LVEKSISAVGKNQKRKEKQLLSELLWKENMMEGKKNQGSGCVMLMDMYFFNVLMGMLVP